MGSTLCGVVCAVLAVLASVTRAELTSEFVSHSLLLTCSTTGLSPGTDVISIVISNTTTASSHQHGAPRDHTLAWMTSEGVPKFGNGSGRGGGQVFVSGLFDKSEAQRSRLELLYLQYNASQSAVFTCRILVHGQQANIESRDYHVQVEAPHRRREEEREEEEEQERAQGSVSASGKDSDTAVKKLTTRDPEEEEQPAVRTGSVLQPTVLETGTPMSVVIAMLVLITLLFVITSILLLQKFKEKCSAQPVPCPAHYALAREGLEAWGDPMGGGLKGSPSLHTMVGLRSHYSLPRPLQPPPPPPKLLRSKSRESDYAAGSSGIPAGMTRSYHSYTTPYDAIVHDEDGELSLLNTSSHCDVTPALPPEQAGESAYKVPRVEAEAQTQGQGHSMYACRIPNGGPAFDLE